MVITKWMGMNEVDGDELSASVKANLVGALAVIDQKLKFKPSVSTARIRAITLEV